MQTLPMFPLGTVLLPGGRLPLRIFEPRYVAMLEHCRSGAGDGTFGVVLIERGSEVGGGDERTDVGTIARIVACEEMLGNRFAVIAVGERRFRIEEWLPDDPYPRAVIRTWPDAPGDAVDWGEMEGKIAEFEVVLRAFAGKTGARVPDLRIEKLRPKNLPAEPSARSFALAGALPISDADRQRALAAPDAAARVATLVDALDDVIAGLRFRIT